VDGRAASGPDLSVTHFSGLKLPNPFVIGSGALTALVLHAGRCVVLLSFCTTLAGLRESHRGLLVPYVEQAGGC
jgi:hypothetical protein